jgi:hypothetical protein
MVAIAANFACLQNSRDSTKDFFHKQNLLYAYSATTAKHNFVDWLGFRGDKNFHEQFAHIFLSGRQIFTSILVTFG